MEIKRFSYPSSLTDIHELNSSFDTGVLRICYTGANHNGSYISREAIEKNVQSLYNCPVVCNYDRETDSLGGHDVEVVRNSDGAMNLVNLTQPVGVIPESAKVWFDNYTEDDGTVHEYLYSDVLLWKRQEAYSKIKRDGITSHSMEITVKQGRQQPDGYYHIDDFEFTAFALIGCNPCFESSALEVFSMADVKQQMSEMMAELKDSFALVNTSNEDDINIKEGGERALEDFNDEVKAPEITAPVSEDKPEFALLSNVTEEVGRMLSAEKSADGWDRYSFADLDTDANEVYAWDSNDWLLYGFSYTINGDSVAIDYNSRKRKKYAIVDFEGSEQPSPFADAYSRMNAKLQSAKDIEAKFADMSASLESANTELNELRKFKADVETADAQAKREAVFSQFEDLNGVDAFENLRENCAQYDTDTLEEKCFAIRGRYGTPMKFGLESNNKVPKLKVDKTEPKENEPYGGIFDKYNK